MTNRNPSTDMSKAFASKEHAVSVLIKGKVEA